MIWTDENTETALIVLAVITSVLSIIGGVTYYTVNESGNRIEMKALDNERLENCFQIGDESERILCMNGVLGED